MYAANGCPGMSRGPQDDQPREGEAYWGKKLSDSLGTREAKSPESFTTSASDEVEVMRRLVVTDLCDFLAFEKRPHNRDRLKRAIEFVEGVPINWADSLPGLRRNDAPAPADVYRLAGSLARSLCNVTALLQDVWRGRVTSPSGEVGAAIEAYLKHPSHLLGCQVETNRTSECAFRTVGCGVDHGSSRSEAKNSEATGSDPGATKTPRQGPDDAGDTIGRSMVAQPSPPAEARESRGATSDASRPVDSAHVDEVQPSTEPCRACGETGEPRGYFWGPRTACLDGRACLDRQANRDRSKAPVSQPDDSPEGIHQRASEEMQERDAALARIGEMSIAYYDALSKPPANDGRYAAYTAWRKAIDDLRRPDAPEGGA